MILSSKENLFYQIKVNNFPNCVFIIIISEGIIRFISQELKDNFIIFLSPIITFIIFTLYFFQTKF